jgi:hypothetical protein
MVFGGPELSSTGFRGGGWIRGKFTRWSKKEEFATKCRCIITRCTYKYGRKSEFGASSGCNNLPTRGWTRTKNHLVDVKELDLGMVVATPSIFYIGEVHVSGANIGTNTESLEKDLN